MPTLSQFPLRHLASLRRAPFWAQALAVCALFAIAGVAILDDYGMAWWVEVTQREIAIANADYIATGDISGLSQPEDIAYRYYGVAFEMPLLLVERALGLQDTRHIYLLRHLITHLFFIAGGFVCAMLTYRMVGNRSIALLAMLLFLLHPRLYAHSFFNSKDVPFAVMLVIALYITHRAFRRDTLGAFLLCGIGVGLAINLRVFGLTLLPMILAMRALDLWQTGRAERRRIALSIAAFLTTALGTAYILHPYYWENPLRLIEGMRALSQHPTIGVSLFMGEIYPSGVVPRNFIPVWFAISAPPVALLLGAFGAAAVCRQAITRPLAALRDRETRFRVLPLGCIALPVAIAVILQANTHNDWRHMYFIWGPFCLLAAVGLRALASDNAGKGGWKVAARLPGWVRGGGRLHMQRRPLAYGIASVGLITTLTAMAALHPHQQVYFNALVDTKTPGALANRYDMDYWQVSRRQSLEHLLARYPDDMLRVWPEEDSALILPQNDRKRIVIAGQREADFYIRPRIVMHRNILDRPALHSIQAYGSDISVIVVPSSDAYRDYYRAAYNDVAANGTLLARSDFDIYIHNGALYYLGANCPPRPRLRNADFRLLLHIFPTNPANLSATERENGFENRDFWFSGGFAFFDRKCVGIQSLPDYPISRIRTGQNAATIGGDEWLADIDMVAYALARALYESIAAGDYGQPAAQSGFDVYLSGNSLSYIKEPCAPGDTDARFFLHIFPANPADLPAAGGERGFANLDFQFTDHGAYAGDKCVATRDLPAYPIERIRTGQFVSGEGRVWGVEFPAAR